MTYEPVAKSSAPKLANTPAPLTPTGPFGVRGLRTRGVGRRPEEGARTGVAGVRGADRGAT